MSHNPGNSGNTWLAVVAGLLTKKQRATVPPAHRRLAAERLERRTVLSVAPLGDDTSVSNLSLNDYLAQEHAMGPVAPPVESPTSDPATQDSLTLDSLSIVQAPATTDYIFSNYQSDGQAEGEGEGSGSGSGTGSSSGSGTTDEPPTISATETVVNGVPIGVAGLITDNSAVGDLTIAVDGPGTFTIGENGAFSIDLTGVTGNGYITITVMDPLGGTTTYTVTY